MTRRCKDCIMAENKKLKEELNRYKEMEAKGLEEFKDVGGCWGCGLQLQFEQDIKDLKKYGQENVELLQENAKLKEDVNEAQEAYNFNRILYKTDKIKLRKALEEIKDHTLDECKRCGKNITSYCELCWVNNILSLCNEVLKDE